ncbi:MAG: PTS sugar transporter subunit IIC [Erysipelotrichaceae bacterium]|nr:PTS sugar transporter subunit IIC [Erysipelotrichaceae bacterium]
MVGAALKCALVYFIFVYLDDRWLGWQTITRPIVVAPITGLLLGDFRTGIIMGASLESIFMGISAIGGAVPADATSASIIAVAFTILNGASQEAGLAIAMPIGAVMSSFGALEMALVAAPLVPYWEKLAQEDMNKFCVQNYIFSALYQLVPTAVMFIAVAYGVEGLNNFLSILPGWVMTGLNAASGMMTAVGFAILTSMIWDGEVGIFFFVGYVLAAYLHLDTLAIAILAVAVAVTMFFSNKKLIDLKSELLAKGVESKDEEDFF